SNVFSIVILSFIPICTMYIFGTLLTANANMRILNYTALCALIVNIVLNSVLVPLKGAFGAAVTALCTYSMVAVTNFVFARMVLRLQINVLSITRFVAFGIIFRAALLFIHTSLNVYEAAFVAILLGFSLMFVLGILNVAAVRKYLPVNIRR